MLLVKTMLKFTVMVKWFYNSILYHYLSDEMEYESSSDIDDIDVDGSSESPERDDL